MSTSITYFSDNVMLGLRTSMNHGVLMHFLAASLCLWSKCFSMARGRLFTKDSLSWTLTPKTCPWQKSGSLPTPKCMVPFVQLFIQAAVKRITSPGNFVIFSSLVALSVLVKALYSWQGAIKFNAPDCHIQDKARLGSAGIVMSMKRTRHALS